MTPAEIAGGRISQRESNGGDDFVIGMGYFKLLLDEI